MRARCLGLLLLVVLPVSAHWVEATDQPDWARRGHLHWALAYTRLNRDQVDLLARHKQTIVQGATYDTAETAAAALRQGLGLMPYVCSRTVTLQEIDRVPALKGAVGLKPDGTEVLAYNNPVRRFGCLFTEAWPEFVRERTRRQWDRTGTWAIFYDNAVWSVEDHHPLAVAGWQKWARAHGLDPGEGDPTGPNDPREPARRRFILDSLTDYHKMLTAYCHGHQPPLLSAPNAGASPYGLWLAEHDAFDLVFYETMSHPPYERNAFRYKAGLACSHGKATGILAYLPERIGAERGVKTWHEGMHYFFYPSSPHAEEFALAIAEGAACGGSYIPNYSLFPSLPVTDLSDPFNQRIHRATEQGYRFLTVNEDLYAGCRPAADVAVLYSTDSDVQARQSRVASAVGDALTRAGLPWEVVVAADFTGPGRVTAKTVIVPSVSHLAAAAAEGLARYVEAGGRVIVTGSFGTHDDYGRPASAPGVSRIKQAIGLISEPIRGWRLDGFEPEGEVQVRATKVPATATLAFAGPAGRYQAYLSLTDESDGCSQFEFAAGGRKVLAQTLDIDDNRQHWFASQPVDLKPGDPLVLTIRFDGGELGRCQEILLVRAGAGGAPLGQGAVVFRPVGLEELTAQQLADLVAPTVRLEQPGEVFINLLGTARGTAVHLVNYGLDYDVTVAGRYASDDGSAETRTFFGSPRTVVRKRLEIARPADVGQPVLRLMAMATPACQAPLVVTINGRRVGQFDPAACNRYMWQELELPREALGEQNLIELRAEGEVDGQQKWWQIGIDASAAGSGSWFSTDGGTTYQQDDLSPDNKPQTGEYLIRIEDRGPGIVPDPNNVAINPGFEQVVTPHAETKITVRPAENLRVVLKRAPAQPGLAISADGPPVWVDPRKEGEQTVYVVPRVATYTVLLTGASREALEPVRQRNLDDACWTIPPVTAPLRSEVTGWEAYLEGFQTALNAGRTGHGITVGGQDPKGQRGASQQIELNQKEPRPIVLTAWSRAENVSAGGSGDYALYVDATCTDGTVFNGHRTDFVGGTHDWHQATLRLEPTKPLKLMRVFLLFRNRTGRVWFDDVTVKVE